VTGDTAPSGDERWLVIDGRRWRRTDPALPEELAARLRSHLGRARSGVKAAKRTAADVALADARARVQEAKTGLGERGPRWWEHDVTERVARAEAAADRLDAWPSVGEPAGGD